MGKFKFEVTEKGVSGIAKGEIVEIDGDKIPGWLVNKGRRLDASKTVVTNPADDEAAKKAADDEAAKKAAGAPPPPAPKK